MCKRLLFLGFQTMESLCDEEEQSTDGEASLYDCRPHRASHSKSNPLVLSKRSKTASPLRSNYLERLETRVRCPEGASRPWQRLSAFACSTAARRCARLPGSGFVLPRRIGCDVNQYWANCCACIELLSCMFRESMSRQNYQ